MESISTRFLVLCCLLLAAVSSIDSRTVSSHRRHCRCLPDHPCFPSAAEWSSLNAEIGGRLLRPRPTASPCHDPEYDEAACRVAMDKWGDAMWISSQVGAMQHPEWEAYDNASCFIGSARNATCSQGSVPVYAVNVSQPGDVEKAFRFAARHNLRVTVKNTGHDFLGRSSGRGSLSIWTHNLKSIQFHESFVEKCSSAEATLQNQPRGSHVASSPSRHVSAVTVGAGVQWRELYEAADAQKKVLVGAFSASVGASGGYAQGGGHSILSPTYGLSADNILEFEVVTPDGKYRIANRCENEDLFWALRGGGGGTFGVVLSATHVAHHAPRSLVAAFYSVSANETSSLRDFLAEFARIQPSLTDAGWGGFFKSTPHGITMTYLLPNHDVAYAENSWKPVLDFANNHQALQMNGVVQTFPSFFEFFNSTLCKLFPTCTDVTGANEIIASRLIPRSTLLESPSKVADAIYELLVRDSKNATRNAVLVMSVGGGKVSEEKNNAVNPAWRNAIWHAIIQAIWEDNATEAERQFMFTDLTEANKILRNLAPGSGSYLNEADYNEPDWQRSSFGSHYGRLAMIKRAVDSAGLLACRHCVGSEEWNEDLDCPV